MNWNTNGRNIDDYTQIIMFKKIKTDRTCSGKADWKHDVTVKMQFVMLHKYSLWPYILKERKSTEVLKFKKSQEFFD